MQNSSGRMGNINTPINPFLIDGTLREEKKEKSDTSLDPFLIEGTLREEIIAKTITYRLLRFNN